MVPFFPRRSTPFLRHVVFIMDTELKKMSLKSVIGVRNDATLASDASDHEAALCLQFWVWFYRIWQVFFWHRSARKRKELR